MKTKGKTISLPQTRRIISPGVSAIVPAIVPTVKRTVTGLVDTKTTTLDENDSQSAENTETKEADTLMKLSETAEKLQNFLLENAGELVDKKAHKITNDRDYATGENSLPEESSDTSSDKRYILRVVSDEAPIVPTSRHHPVTQDDNASLRSVSDSEPSYLRKLKALLQGSTHKLQPEDHLLPLGNLPGFGHLDVEVIPLSKPASDSLHLSPERSKTLTETGSTRRQRYDRNRRLPNNYTRDREREPFTCISIKF